MSAQETEKGGDLKASIIQKSNEEKLMTMLESQKSIIAERDNHIAAKPKKKGFFSFLNCCMTAKSGAQGATLRSGAVPPLEAKRGPKRKQSSPKQSQIGQP